VELRTNEERALSARGGARQRWAALGGAGRRWAALGGAGRRGAGRGGAPQHREVRALDRLLLAAADPQLDLNLQRARSTACQEAHGGGKGWARAPFRFQPCGTSRVESTCISLSSWKRFMFST